MTSLLWGSYEQDSLEQTSVAGMKYSEAELEAFPSQE